MPTFGPENQPGEPASRVVVLMGVSGSGKSTIAAALHARLGWDECEGDDLHPPANVAKMAAGHALSDADRAPWLARIAGWIDAHLDAGRPGIVTCSALRRAYRDVLRRDGVVFVLLDATSDVLAARLAVRAGHFMPATLLGSQLATLEPPGPDEVSINLAVDAAPDVLAERIVAALAA